MIHFLILGSVMLLLLPIAIKYGTIRYKRYCLARDLKLAMSNLFLEKQIEKAIELPLASSDYVNVVNNGLKTLIGPGYRAGVLHCRREKVYLTLIHLSGNIETMAAFTQLIDANVWSSVEVECLTSLFISKPNLGTLLHYELGFYS